MKILVIVPAYNEEESLPGVISDLRRHVPGAAVVVVNDGSVDRTPQIARALGVTVLDLPVNLGIGGAVQAGYLYAAKHDYDVAVQFDGDGQHRAEEIEKLLRPLAAGEADLVIGSRFVQPGDYQAPFFRRIGMCIFSFTLSRILDSPVTDTTSGFRAVNKKAAGFFSRSYPEDYPEVEALVLAHKQGLRIAEVPVSMRGRTGGQTSITALRSAYYMVKVLLAVFIDLLKKAR
jgi:glycosyltransferase involved in cell wall biosynthesis